MNILFVNHAGLASNSAGHIAFFALALARLDHDCRLAVPDADDVAADDENFPLAQCPAAGFQRTLERPRAFRDGRVADIVHVWTPREHVRKFAFAYLRQAPAARLFVHLEDNERFVTERFTGTPFDVLGELPRRELAQLLPAHCAHPRWMEIFLRMADGVTGIVDSLRDFVPAGIPFLTLVPGVDFTLFSPGPPDASLRAELGLRPEEKILVYTGNSHPANHGELLNLYRAVELLNTERGVPCRLVRTGRDTDADATELAAASSSPFVRHLGVVDKASLPALLRLADVLVQPGGVNDFNRYRLPSKLAEFLSVGRPTILPACNVASAMTEGEDALFLRDGTPAEIADACLRVFADPKLAATLAANGAALARRLFNGGQAVAALRDFYARCGEAPPNGRIRCLQRIPDATSAAGEARLIAELLRVEIGAAGGASAGAPTAPTPGNPTGEGGIDLLLNTLVGAAADEDVAPSRADGARCQVFFSGRDGAYDESASGIAHFSTDRWHRLVFWSPENRSAAPIRIDPTDQPGLIEIAGVALRDAASRSILWQARSGTALSQIQVAGTGRRLPHPRLLRVFNSGIDPQLFLPELSAALADQPLQLVLWIRLESDLERIGEVLGESVDEDAAQQEIRGLAATVKSLEAAYAGELERRRALQTSLAWKLTLPLQKALRLVSPSRGATNGNGRAAL